MELRLSHLHECVDDDALLGFVEACTGTIPPLEIVDLAANYNVSARGLGPFLDKVQHTIKVLDVSLCNKLDDKFGEALANCLQLDEVVMVDSPLLGDGLTAWYDPCKKTGTGRSSRPRADLAASEPEPKRIRLTEALTMQAAFSGTVDVSARCRVPRYAEPRLRNLFRKCGNFWATRFGWGSSRQ